MKYTCTERIFHYLSKNVIIWKERRGDTFHAGVLFAELLIKFFWSPQVATFFCNFPTLDLRENIFCSFDSSYISFYFVTIRLSQLILEIFWCLPWFFSLVSCIAQCISLKCLFIFLYQRPSNCSVAFLFQWYECGHPIWFLLISKLCLFMNKGVLPSCWCSCHILLLKKTRKVSMD